MRVKLAGWFGFRYGKIKQRVFNDFPSNLSRIHQFMRGIDMLIQRSVRQANA